jgi:hypothetical protein
MLVLTRVSPQLWSNAIAGNCMEVQMDNNFDLIGTLEKVRDIYCPKKLFEAWERLSYAYLRRELSSNDLDEVKAVVWNQFAYIDAISKVQLNTAKVVA